MRAVHCAGLLLLLAASFAAADEGRIQFTFATSESTYLPGEHVFATATLRNLSTAPIACVYPMDPGLGFLMVSLRETDSNQPVPRLCHDVHHSFFSFSGCELSPGEEHVEVVVLTECYGYRDSSGLALPEPLVFSIMLPGRYEVSAEYSVPSIPGREGYSIQAAPVAFEVKAASEDEKSQVWLGLARSFPENTLQYREELSDLVMKDLENPLKASLFLDSSLFHNTPSRRDTFLKIVKQHPDIALSGYLMSNLCIAHWYFHEQVWPKGYLESLAQEHPRSIASRVAKSLAKYWECASRANLPGMRSNRGGG